MTDIPADIITSGRRCYDALGRGSISDSERIMRAILAERNRCADIALAIDSGRGNEKMIAAAIRSPTPPSAR